MSYLLSFGAGLERQFFIMNLGRSRSFFSFIYGKDAWRMRLVIKVQRLHLNWIVTVRIHIESSRQNAILNQYTPNAPVTPSLLSTVWRPKWSPLVAEVFWRQRSTQHCLSDSHCVTGALECSASLNTMLYRASKWSENAVFNRNTFIANHDWTIVALLCKG